VAVDIAAVAEADNHDDQDIVPNLVYDSMVADADTVQVIESGQPLTTGWSRVVGEGANSVIDTIAKRLWKISQFAHGAFGELYGVSHLLTAKAEFPFYCIVGNGAFPGDFREGLDGLLAVDAILPLFKAAFEEPEVGYGNDCGQRPAVLLEKHGFPVLDVLDGIGEVIVGAVKRSLRHGPDSSALIIAGIGLHDKR
jgi:hypothetical protein